MKKMAIFIRENALRPLENHDMESWKQLGGDASENGDFQSGKQHLQGTNVFQELLFYIQKEMNSWGRCVGKWRFSKKETTFAGTNVFQELSFYIQKEMNS